MNNQREWQHRAAHHRQAFLNALPAYAKTVGLAELGEEPGSTLVNGVLGGLPMQVSVPLPAESDELLRQAFFARRSWERTHGSNPFALGFPLFLGQAADGQPIAAPLFCWELQLDPGHKPSDGWAITHLPAHRLSLNPYLLSHFHEKEGGLEAARLMEQFLAQPDHRIPALHRLLERLSEALSLEAPRPYEAPLPLPDARLWAGLEGNGLLAYCGVLGVFPGREWMQLDPPDTRPAYSGVQLAHRCSPVLPGPYQASAARLLEDEGMLWLQGPAGTGKSTLARHLLLNALANGQNCLVVAPQVQTLRTYEAMLEEQGMGRLGFVLRDTAPDKTLYAEIARAALQESTKEDAFNDEARYQQLCQKLERLEGKVRKPYEASRKPMAQGRNWMDTVGAYLRSSRKEGKELLSTQLNASDYQFDDEEFAGLQEAIGRCYELYQRTTTLHSPLSRLSPGIFLRMEKEEARSFVEEQTRRLSDKGSRLQLWYINRQNAYADQLMAHYEQYYQRFARDAAALTEEIAEGRDAYGTDYTEGGSLSLKVKSAFSSSAKSARAARESTLENYELFSAAFERSPYFDFQLPAPGDKLDLQQLSRVLRQFEEALQRWRTGLREAVQEDVNRLSLKSANPRLGFERQVEELEESLDRWVAEVNESGLYHLPLNNKMLTIPKRQRFLEEALEQLDTTRRALPGFDNFYDWQRNWLQLDEKSRRLVKALLKVRPDDWQAAYETWFLDNLLDQSYEAVLPPEADDLRAFGESRQALLKLLVPRTLAYWQEERSQLLRRWKRRDRKAYQRLLKEGGQAYTATQLLRQAPEVVRSVSPALMMNPALAAECFHAQEKAFGLIIVEGADQVEGGLLEHLMPLGVRVLFLSPEPVQQADSLPPEIAVQQCPVYNLQHTYAAAPGDLNTAGRGLHSDAPASAFFFEQVDGRYDEQQETNEAEALRAVALLNQVERTPQRTFPSIGIVCMTEGQRNLISALLLDIKQRRTAGVETIQQLERNGLAVLELSEIGGQQFDIVLLSSTYGPIGLEAEIPGHYHRLESLNNQQRLLQLMSRARQRVWALNSLPGQWLDECTGQEGPLPPGELLPAYLAYLRAYAMEDESTLPQLQQRVAAGRAEQQQAQPPQLWLKELQHYLRPYAGGGQISVRATGFTGEAALAIEQGVQQLVLPDGFFGNSPYTDFAWEQARRQQMEAQGIKIRSSWSPNWWRNAEMEARTLAGRLLSVMPREVPLQEEEE